MSKKDFLARKCPAGARPTLLARLWRDPGESATITYSGSAVPESRADDKRRESRRRTRLRAGKILDRANRFLTDATIIDRSCGGLKLRLAREVAVPEIFHFFDEESEAIFVARLVWRRRLLLGARRGRAVVATPRQIAALRGKFYGIEG